MSPGILQGSDSEDPRRAISPQNVRSVKPTNGVVSQPFPANKGKGKAPMRPRREDDDVLGTDDGMDDSYSRERAMTPDQTARAKSPAQFSVASRAVSPANGFVDGQPPSLVGTMNGIPGRASPAIDRTRPPVDAFYQEPQGSPIASGFPGHGHGRNGSVTVTADLLKDLKTKEAQLESMKKQTGWMKAALAQASRTGFVYSERDTSEAGDETEGEGSNNGMLLKFKQLKAQLQVRTIPRIELI